LLAAGAWRVRPERYVFEDDRYGGARCRQATLELFAAQTATLRRLRNAGLPPAPIPTVMAGARLVHETLQQLGLDGHRLRSEVDRLREWATGLHPDAGRIHALLGFLHRRHGDSAYLDFVGGRSAAGPLAASHHAAGRLRQAWARWADREATDAIAGRIAHMLLNRLFERDFATMEAAAYDQLARWLRRHASADSCHVQTH
jgi:hypothetical protein